MEMTLYVWLAVLFTFLAFAFVTNTYVAPEASGAVAVSVNGIAVNAINTATGQGIIFTNQGFTSSENYGFGVGLGISNDAIITGAVSTTSGFTLVQTTGLQTGAITMYLRAPSYPYNGDLELTAYYYTPKSQQASAPQTAFFAPMLCGIIGAIRGIVGVFALALLVLSGIVFALSAVVRDELEGKMRVWAAGLAATGVVSVILVVLAPVIIGIIEMPFAPFALPC